MTISYLYSKFFKKFLRGKAIYKSKIDKSSVVNSGSSVYNSLMGRYSYCGYDCEIYSCDVGAFCSIADHVFIGGAEHPLDWVSTSPVFQRVSHSGPQKKFSAFTLGASKRTIIGDDVWIGHNVTVKQGVTIGIGSVIGAGSIVTKDIPPYAIAVGCPARVIKYRFTQDIITRLLDSKWWTLCDEDLDKVAPFIKNPEAFLGEVSRLKQ